MISEIAFKSKLKELQTLMGTVLKMEFVTEAYKRISKGTYTEDDLSRAVEDMLNGTTTQRARGPRNAKAPPTDRKWSKSGAFSKEMTGCRS